MANEKKEILDLKHNVEMVAAKLVLRQNDDYGRNKNITDSLGGRFFTFFLKNLGKQSAWAVKELDRLTQALNVAILEIFHF